MSEYDTLYLVTMPGKCVPQRHDHRRKTPKPPAKPLQLPFTPKQLVQLARNVEKARELARKAPRRRRRHSGFSTVRCPICWPLRCSLAEDA